MHCYHIVSFVGLLPFASRRPPLKRKRFVFCVFQSIILVTGGGGERYNLSDKCQKCAWQTAWTQKKKVFFESDNGAYSASAQPNPIAPLNRSCSSFFNFWTSLSLLFEFSFAQKDVYSLHFVALFAEFLLI